MFFMESGIRDQNSHRFWDQGSRFWVKIWDQLRQNIPRYDPDIMTGRKINNLIFVLLCLQKALTSEICIAANILGHLNYYISPVIPWKESIVILHFFTSSSPTTQINARGLGSSCSQVFQISRSRNLRRVRFSFNQMKQ